MPHNVKVEIIKLDYITINVNKRFLIRTALLIIAVVAVIGSYKRGYKTGVMDAVNYMMSVQPGTAAPSNLSF